MTTAAKSNNWKWFFAVVVLLGLFSSGGLVWYNLSQQLKPEQLEAARKLWTEKGPASYTLIYKSTFSSRTDGQSQSNHYVVKVANRKVTEVLVNGIPLTERLEYHDMDGVFNEVERFQELDEKEKRRVFRRGRFDPHNGAILEYVRRVMGTSERQEIRVETLEAK